MDREPEAAPVSAPTPVLDDGASDDEQHLPVYKLPASQMGGTLSSLMSVFRREYPASQGKKAGFDELQTCGYLRQYEIESAGEKEQRRATGRRASSWNLMQT